MLIPIYLRMLIFTEVFPYPSTQRPKLIRKSNVTVGEVITLLFYNAPKKLIYFRCLNIFAIFISSLAMSFLKRWISGRKCENCNTRCPFPPFRTPLADKSGGVRCVFWLRLSLDI